MEKMKLTDRERAARNEYIRQWRRKNPDKVREYQRRWLSKLADKAEQETAAANR